MLDNTTCKYTESASSQAYEILKTFNFIDEFFFAELQVAYNMVQQRIATMSVCLICEKSKYDWMNFTMKLLFKRTLTQAP